MNKENAQEIFARLGAVSLSVDEEIRKTLEEELAEYRRIVESYSQNPEAFAEERLLRVATYKVAVASAILTVGKVSLLDLMEQEKTKYPALDPLEFYEACGVIAEYLRVHLSVST
ncbi:hypothetical protein EXS57_00110 [Candidatus Kaiserbacteria bacterium]|nr:hypothetical protein [Candidatus Kaiserbacteria bacterium]